MVDVTFGSSGGFVNLDALSSLVPGRFSSERHPRQRRRHGRRDRRDDTVTAPSISTVNNDTIRTLDGDDSITTGNGSDIVSGGDDADVIVANDGNNILNGGEFADDDSGDGNDTITGGPLFDIIDGGLGDDTLNGGTDADATDNDDFDQIDGRRGNDVDQRRRRTRHRRRRRPRQRHGQRRLRQRRAVRRRQHVRPGRRRHPQRRHGRRRPAQLRRPDAFNGGDETAASATRSTTARPAGSSPIQADIDGGAGDDGVNCQLGPCEGDSIAADVENLTGDGGPTICSPAARAPTCSTAEPGDDALDGGSGVGSGRRGPVRRRRRRRPRRLHGSHRRPGREHRRQRRTTASGGCPAGAELRGRRRRDGRRGPDRRERRRHADRELRARTPCSAAPAPAPTR